MAAGTSIDVETWAALQYGTPEWIRWHRVNVVLQVAPTIPESRADRYRAEALAGADEVVRRTRATAADAPRGDPVKLQRLTAAVLDALIIEADVRPRPTDGPDGPRLVLGAMWPTAFDALVVLLMLAAWRRGGLAVCSGCAMPYVRTRRAARGRRNYCPECRRAKVDRRDAQAAWVARNPDYFRSRLAASPSDGREA
jgi:hypothetical protein